MRIAIVRRGISRGELPLGVDVELLVDLISAPVQRALLFNERIESKTIDRVLDVVLAGAAADAATRSRPRRGVTNRSATAARRAKKP